MGKKIEQIINSLPPDRKEKVEKRARELLDNLENYELSEKEQKVANALKKIRTKNKFPESMLQPEPHLEIDKIPEPLWPIQQNEPDDDWLTSASVVLTETKMAPSVTTQLPVDGSHYRFNEGNLLHEMKEYIDKTYQGHYSGKYQATDIIIDAGHGIGFNLGNVMKYAKRYGKKNGFNRDDILKLIHYGFLALYTHDYNLEKAKEPSEKK